MDENRQNYCFLLGLNPFKESSYTADAILKKIAAKHDKWANDSRNKQNDTEQRFKAERLVDMCPDMERVMRDPNLRRGEFSRGQALLKRKVSKLRTDCVILADGTYVCLPGAADAYTKKLHWDGVSKADVLRLAGISEGAPPKPVSDKILNAYKGLRAVDTYTPAEMLNALIRNPNLEISVPPLSEGSSFAQMRDAFEACEKRVNSVRPDVLPEQDSYIQSMRSVKLVLEPDSELRRLIDYGRCNRALVPVMETMEQEYSTQLTRAYIDELLNAHVSKDVDVDMAIGILQQFCHKKKMAANFSNADSSMIRCPECGVMIPGGSGSMFCPMCGKSFRTVCPQCNTQQQARNAICIKCGFNFKEGMQQAESLALDFRMNMQNGRVSKAEGSLARLGDRFPGYSNLAQMSRELEAARTEIRTSRRFIMDAYDRRRYSEAMGAADSLLKRYPDVMEGDVELAERYRDCSERKRMADIRCQNATLAATKQERMEQYVGAADVCPDHPTARAKLRENPPPGPVDGLCSLGEKQFTIKVVPPPDAAGLTYCVFRERNTLPAVTEDTAPLAEIPNTVFSDRGMDPGVQYYYSVFSKRWGILSREAFHAGPVMIMSEVDNVGLEPIDGGLRITYEKPRGASRVRIWRSEGMDTSIGVEVPLNGATVYDDLGLEGGKRYYYLFVVEYSVRGRVERSQGVIFSECTIRIPKPVWNLMIRRNSSDGTFNAVWKSEENVSLYSSPKKINMPGTMVAMEDVRSWMTEIQPIHKYDDGIKFALPDGAVRYIYPIIPCGRMGIRGNEVLVTNLKPFRDVEYAISNRDCFITMSWPDNAVEAKIVISDGAEAKGLDDRNAETVTVRREEYMDARQIRIPVGKQRRRCVNIFAMYDIESKLRPSRGIAIEINSGESRKAVYTVKKDRRSAEITISTDPSADRIPPVMLVQASEGIPLKRTDGKVVWRSDGPVPLSEGSATVTVGGPVQIEACRLFFENDSDYYEFRFVHPLHGGK